MPIDPVIALSVKNPQFADPLDTYSKVAAIQQAQQQTETGALQQQELRRQIGERDRVLAAFQGMQPGQSPEDILPAVYRASPTTGMTMQKTLLENRKLRGDIDSTQAQTALRRLELSKQITEQGIQQLSTATPETWGAIRQNFIQQHGGRLSPEESAQFPEQYPGQQWVSQKLQSLLSVKDRLERLMPKAEFVKEGGQVTPRNPYTAEQMGAAIPMTATPGERMTDARMREFSAMPGIGTPEGDRQLDYWAEVVRNGGSLPPGLARGPGGSAFVREVTRRVAMGDTAPKEMMANQAGFVGEKAGQRTLGTRTANIEMAATEAASLADLAKQASAKVDRTQYKSLNDALQAGQRATSSPELRAFTASNTSLINAYARAINPQGVGTVADKEHAREMLSTAFSKGDYNAAVDQLLKEIEAARKSPGQVKTEMRDRFTGKEPEPAPAVPSQTFQNLPDPAQFSGKFMTDTTTGGRFQSNGRAWVRVQGASGSY